MIILIILGIIVTIYCNMILLIIVAATNQGDYA